MFTQNFQNFMHNSFFGFANSNHYSGTLYGKDYVGADGNTVKAYSGDDHNAKGFGAAMRMPTFAAPGSGIGVYFGTDSTPATVNDYKLNSPITSGVQKVNTTLSSVKEADGRYSVCGHYTIQNVSDAPINIYEIGVYTGFYTSSSGDTKYVLMERTVLTKPITIGVNEVKTITYKLTFNHTLNVEQ